MINHLNAYTIPYKFLKDFTLLIANDLNLYILKIKGGKARFR